MSSLTAKALAARPAVAKAIVYLGGLLNAGSFLAGVLLAPKLGTLEAAGVAGALIGAGSYLTKIAKLVDAKAAAEAIAES